MDIIAYGAASQEKRRAKELADLLGPDVEGTSETLEGRLDALMESMDDVTRLADRVILRDAVNLMKAEARLNTIVQAKKYGMEHMVFDDLLDLSGIDTTKSTGYVHDALNGRIQLTTGKIETKAIQGTPDVMVPVIDSSPGMTVTVIIDGDEEKKEILLPETANRLKESVIEGGVSFSVRIEGTGTIKSVGTIWT